MNFIEANLVDTDQRVIDFVESEKFSDFKDIMNRLYLEKLSEFHAQTPEKLEASRATLTMLLNLPSLLEHRKALILQNRKAQREASERI